MHAGKDSKMKAAVFYGKGDIRVEEHAIPAPAADQVQLRVKAAGVCGTDMHIYAGAKGATECEPPVVLGHEFSGVVEQVGAGVTRFRAGDRVTVDPNIACHACHFCRTGRPHLCEGMVATGVNLDGGFAQLCNVREEQTYLLPDGVSFEEGALCEPVGCCLHGMDMARVHAGDYVVIVGGGPIGQIMLQLAILSGAAAVAVVEPIAEKRALAMKLGAALTLDTLTQDVPAELKHYGIGHVDVSIECVGRRETMLDAIRYAGRGATVLLFGLTPPDCEIPFKPFEAFQKELTVAASFTNPHTHERAIRLIASGRLRVRELVGEELALEDVTRALTGAVRPGKTLIRP